MVPITFGAQNTDSAFGFVASAKPARAVGFEAAIIALASTKSGRRYALRATPGGPKYAVDIVIGDGDQHTVISLPTIIRGHFVASLVDFAALEMERCIQPNEIARRVDRS